MSRDRPGAVGMVSLVGAGPGDPGLITIRGRRAIERADVVLYDRLASPALLAAITVPGQERIHVGKTAGSGLDFQENITELLLRRAREGQRVVRLKGGDPMVLGRGGEEAAACAEALIPFEIIPGVSAVTAVPAYAGIPLTHRDTASGFVVVNGFERPDAPHGAVDWDQVARYEGTIVVLMGVLQTRRWTEALVGAGKDPRTPAALIRWGTTPRQQTLTSTLGSLAADAQQAKLRPPAVAVVGDAVGWRATLAWFDQRPLMGRVIAVTRSASADLGPFEALEDLGAAVIHLPLTRQRSMDDGALAKTIGERAFTDVVVTSANGVRCFAEALDAAGQDARDLHGVTTWAVGPGTARSLARLVGVRADHVPGDASGEGLVALARSVGVESRTFLFPAARGARAVVPDGLRGLGAEVCQVTSYETVSDPLAAARIESAATQGLSLVALASPSAVDAWLEGLEAVGRQTDEVAIAAIGPTTAQHASTRGLHVAVVAETHTMAGLASAIVDWARASGTSADEG